MLKVAYISHFSHMKMGGQKSMVHLIEHIDRSKIIPIAICPEKGELSEKLESLGCKTFFIPLYSIKPKHYLQVWKSFRQIRNLINTEHIDILHSDRDADTLICGLAKRKTNAKLVWHARVNAPNPKDKWNFKLSDAVIGVSIATGNRFERFQNFQFKYRSIYNGVDTDIFKPVENKALIRNELNLPAEKFILIFVGQITKGKGVFDLINALNIFKNQIPEKQIPLTLFIGTFGEREEEQQFNSKVNELSLNTFIHQIPQQKNIEKWLQSADALIIPSHEGVEGMPRVLYEAMACGIAGIGSDTSGVRETIVNESGLLVKEKNPEDIADKISLLINNRDLLIKLQIKGRERAVKYFDIREHAKKVLDVYNEICSFSL